ncbi:MAG TPA: aspartyl protease family protein [Terracidiphilus sp.]|nr:aspartyl protease family protein [Terracidiphilus sp.]
MAELVDTFLSYGEHAVILPFQTHRVLPLILAGLFLSSAACCAQQQAAAAPAEAAPPASGLTVPAKNGVEMSGTINGQGPFKILFDTGSGNLISAHLATRLGLKPENQIFINAGSGTLPAQTAIIDTIKIGSLAMSKQSFAIVEPAFAKNQDFAVVGDQLVQNLAIKVDFEHQQITFYDESNFVYSGKTDPIPVHVLKGALYAEATVDGFTGLFGIDTSDSGSLSLDAQLVARGQLVQRYGATIHGYASESWAGPESGYYTRVGTLKLGNLTINRPITVLLTNGQGADVSNEAAGSIGRSILRQFTILFDCPHGVLYLEPNSRFGQPDIFNRAGLVLEPASDHPEIKLVVPGSPADAAKLAAGDVITELNGSAPTDESLENAFAQAAGTTVQVTVMRDGKSRTVSLVLKDVL